MVGLISKRSRDYVRRRTTSTMETQIRIERSQRPSYSKTSMTVTSGARVVIYEGPARMWTTSGSSDIIIGPDSIPTHTTRVSIPWDTELIPKINDDFVVISSESDSAMDGRRGVITDTVKAGDLRPSRTFNVMFQEDDRTHVGDQDG